ncbi:MAG: type II 3-dehydroquinate dehydratase [Mycoplasmatales bacterium]
MKILIINGPNLNMLGLRESNIYGIFSYEEMNEDIKKHHYNVEFYQSNHEGDLIDKIHQCVKSKKYDGLVINPGAYSHTSIAIMDALLILDIPKVEVHISEVEKREDFRKVSYTKLACDLTISGHGIEGYKRAVDYIQNQYK